MPHKKALRPPWKNPMKTEILVCVTCKRPDEPQGSPRSGRLLYDAIQAQASRDALPFAIRAIECLSGCSQACTVAFQANGKHAYLFGDLTPGAETAGQVIDCAKLHQGTSDGVMLRGERPELLRNGMIARLPPLLPPG